MCLYQTYHWSCCPGTSKPTPYFMNSICPEATTPKYIGGKRKKCKIQFTILDGADYGETCPKCLQPPPDEADEVDADEAEETEEAEASTEDHQGSS